MQMKRVLAVIMSAAMIASSGLQGFAAEEDAIVLEETASADESSSVDSAQEDSTGDPAAENITVEEAAEEGSSDEASMELSLEDAATEEISAEEIDITEEAVSLDETEAELMATASDCFGVTDEGVLTWTGGSGYLPSDAVIPEEVRVIPAGVFTVDRFRKDSTTTIRFEGAEPVVTVAADAFKNCTRPFSVKGKAIKSVGKNAFSGCVGLVTISLDNAERIDDYAFFNCTKLKSVVVGGNLAYIGEYAFYSTQLEELDLSVVTAEGFKMKDKAFESCEKLVTVILPDVLEEVPFEAFRECTALKTVIFGTGSGKLHTIGASAFEECKALSNLEFFNVKTFGSSAFAGCSGIKSIIINYEGEDIAISENAFPANPANWKISMTGKSAAVRSYAARHGYVYYGQESAISVVFNPTEYSKNATVKTFVNNKAAAKAEEGTTVKVTVTPNEGFVLDKIDFATKSGANYVSIKADDWTYIGEKDKALNFEFTMQDKDTFVIVTLKPLDKVKFTSLSMKLKKYKDNIFDSAGIQDKAIVYNGSTEVGPWYWNFTSSATGCLAVAEDGTVTAIKEKDQITVTATLKTDTSVKTSLKLSIKDPVTIKQIQFAGLANTMPRDARFIEAKDDPSGYDVIEVMNYYNSTSDLVFKARINAYETEEVTSNGLYVKSTWKSVDSNIAAVGAETSYNNENTIVVKKGIRGETMITVSVLNKGEKTASDANTKSFILRIIDPTPRISTQEITVNYASSTGTELGLIPVKGYPVEGSSLRLVDAKNKESKELKVYKSSKDGKFYIAKHDNNTKVKSKEYTGNTQLFLVGEFGGASKGVEFSKIAITKIILTDKPLAPTLTNKGKINLFYKGSDAGVVEVTQSVKNAAVESFELVSKERKSNPKAEDKFRGNFDCTYNAETRTFTITRKDSALLKDNSNKAVVSGYLAISYAGYSNPVYLALTVPTEVTKPTYALSTKSATKNARVKDHEFDLQIVRKVKINKKTELQTLELDPSEVELTYDSKALYEIVSVEDNTIRLHHKGNADNSKAQIVVHKDEWSDDLTFTFTLKSTSALPATTLSATKVTLNRNYPEEAGSFELAELTDGEYESVSVVPAGKNPYDCANFEFTEGRKVVVTLKDDKVAPGTYSFSVVPKVNYGTISENLKAATVKVVVTDNKPKVKLKTATFTFNANYPGMETVTSAYTINNLPLGTEKNVEITDVTFTPSGHAYGIDKIADVEVKEGVVSAVIKDTTEVYINKGKTLKYTVNAKVGGKAMEPFTISIKLTKAVPSVTLKATGSINPIDSSSYVTYTATVKNLVTTDPGFEFVELDSKGRQIPVADYHFELVRDEKKSNVVYIRVKDDKSVEDATKYTLRMKYTNIPLAKETKLTVTPKQVLPKIKTDVKSKTLYSLAENRKFDINVTHVIDKNSPVKTPAIKNITWAKDTPASVKKAFKVTNTFPDSNDLTRSVVTVELINPAALVQNQTYTLNLAVIYEEQAPNSTGNKVTVKVTVKK